MTRPSPTFVIVAVAAAFVICLAAFLIGRASGAHDAPALSVERVERIDRPRIGPQILLPAPISIPARLPR